MIRRRLVVIAAAGLLLAGCGGSDGDAKADPTPSTSAPTQATINPKEAACSYLSAADRRKLTGTALDTVVATAGSGDSSECRWQADSALVQVTSLPAREWAKTLPNVVAQLEKSGTTGKDAKDLARAKKLLSGATSFTDEQACAAFTTLAEIGGAKKGATTKITPVPISETESGLSAQICTSGELTSVIYSVPGLKETKQADAAITTALKSAQNRALAAG